MAMQACKIYAFCISLNRGGLKRMIVSFSLHRLSYFNLTFVRLCKEQRNVDIAMLNLEIATVTCGTSTVEFDKCTVLGYETTSRFIYTLYFR
jgi:hypothetical protein